MLLGPPLIWSTVDNFVGIAGVGVEDHDPTHALIRSLALEGDLLPIGRPHWGVVAPAFGRVRDLVDMAPIGVHREESTLGLIGIEVAAEDDLTVGGSSATALALVVPLASITLSRALASTGAQCQSNESYHHPCSQERT